MYFSSNTPGNKKEEIMGTLGVKEVERFESYLGLPTLIGRAKYRTCKVPNFLILKGSSLEKITKVERHVII